MPSSRSSCWSICRRTWHGTSAPAKWKPSCSPSRGEGVEVADAEAEPPDFAHLNIRSGAVFARARNLHKALWLSRLMGARWSGTDEELQQAYDRELDQRRVHERNQTGRDQTGRDQTGRDQTGPGWRGRGSMKSSRPTHRAMGKGR